MTDKIRVTIISEDNEYLYEAMFTSMLDATTYADGVMRMDTDAARVQVEVVEECYS